MRVRRSIIVMVSGLITAALVCRFVVAPPTTVRAAASRTRASATVPRMRAGASARPCLVNHSPERVNCEARGGYFPPLNNLWLSFCDSCADSWWQLQQRCELRRLVREPQQRCLECELEHRRGPDLSYFGTIIKCRRSAKPLG